MDLCSEGHEEVCYESRTCPVCAMRDGKDEEIEELKSESRTLSKQVDELEAKIDELESQQS